ncbi:hypothetical protein Pfo_031570 [Paulownia fortunei]|nr:hypothetical protein Pfo_031570 [Paulownia fortunei]
MGVIKIDSFPIFVVDAIPGETIRVVVTKVLKNYAFGRVIKRVTVSPDRVSDVDQVAITTGIAPLANLKLIHRTTSVLYTLAAKKAGLKATDTVVDAYSGIGTITLSIADRVKKVYGVEVIEGAVADAEKECTK